MIFPFYFHYLNIFLHNSQDILKCWVLRHYMATIVIGPGRARPGGSTQDPGDLGPWLGSFY